MKTIITVSAALLLLAGCKSNDAVVFNHITTNKTECITFNGKPITIEKVISLANSTDYGKIDLIVITTNGTEKTDLKEWDDGLSNFVSYGLSSPDE